MKLQVNTIKEIKTFTFMNEVEFASLKTSILTYGQIQPIGIIKSEESYICIYGTKILKALKELNKEECFCLLHNYTLEDYIKIYIQTQLYEKKFDYVLLSEEIKKTNLNPGQLANICSLELDEIKELLELTNYDWSIFLKKQTSLDILEEDNDNQLDLFTND